MRKILNWIITVSVVLAVWAVLVVCLAYSTFHSPSPVPAVDSPPRQTTKVKPSRPAVEVQPTEPKVAESRVVDAIDSNPQPTPMPIQWERGDGILNFIAWNVQSGDNSPRLIAKQMKDFAGADIVALNEAGRKNVPAYTAALGDGYLSYVSKTGRADHLAILFDSKRFDVLEKKEMFRHGNYRLNNGTDLKNQGTHRSPIYVRLKERKSGLEFIFMTNHLARQNNELRRQQAAGLREWARDTSTPIIAMGDFNFDYNFKKQDGNRSFGIFMQDGVWDWVKPNPLIDTQWSGTSYRDRYPGSMLDFVFVANGAKEFKSKCTIIVRDGDFPQNKMTSDHRATRAEIRFAPEVKPQNLGSLGADAVLQQ